MTTRCLGDEYRLYLQEPNFHLALSTAAQPESVRTQIRSAILR